MDVLVISGGIGSGKSEVCLILREEFSCGVYSADERVKALYVSHRTLLTEIERTLRCSFRDGNGNFSPVKLAEMIFKDRNALVAVEDLVFPVLIEDFREWSKEYQTDDFVVFESATVLEKEHFAGFGDKVIIVDAPFSIRAERVCSRDSSSREAVLARMANQKMMNLVSEGMIPEAADAVICNDGSLEDLRQRTVALINELYFNKHKHQTK